METRARNEQNELRTIAKESWNISSKTAIQRIWRQVYSPNAEGYHGEKRKDHEKWLNWYLIRIKFKLIDTTIKVKAKDEILLGWGNSAHIKRTFYKMQLVYFYCSCPFTSTWQVSMKDYMRDSDIHRLFAEICLQ